MILIARTRRRLAVVAAALIAAVTAPERSGLAEETLDGGAATAAHDVAGSYDGSYDGYYADADDGDATDRQRENPPAVPSGSGGSGPVAGGRSLEVTALPWARLPLDDASMGAVSERAGELVRSGFRLGQRGAYYSARGEFVQALRMIAQSLDVNAATDMHGKALAAGLRAMQEAEDFVPRRPAVEADVDVPSLVASHRTPILKEVPGLEQLGVFGAIRAYYTYSQEQLAAAASHEPAGSMALYGLARVRTALAADDSSRHLSSEPAAICLHQAALMVRSDNFMAANELGVLLARHGRFEDAKQVLRHSVEAAPSREGIHNLAVVYARLGQSDISAELESQVDQWDRQPRAPQSVSADARVIWLDAEAFARTGGQPGPLQPDPQAFESERVTEKSEANKPKSAAPSGRRYWPWR